MGFLTDILIIRDIYTDVYDIIIAIKKISKCPIKKQSAQLKIDKLHNTYRLYWESRDW